MARFVVSFLLLSMLIFAVATAKTSSKSRPIRSGVKYNKSVRDVPKPKSYFKEPSRPTARYIPIKSQPKCGENIKPEPSCAQVTKPRKTIEKCTAEPKMAAYEIDSMEPEPELSSEVFCSECCSSCHCSSESPVININTYPPNYVSSDEKVVNEDEEETLEEEEKIFADERKKMEDYEMMEIELCASRLSC